MCPSAAHDPHAGDHDARLEAAVVAALDAGFENLRSFLGALTGADPVLAVDTLQRHNSGAYARQVRELLNEAVTPLALTSSDLPIPHPLDFAWLFTPETQADLLNQVSSSTRPGELVVYLGCPTLHHRGLSGLPDRQHLLLDRDARRAARANEYSLGSARRLDLLTDALEPMDAVLVVADPPWYPEAAAAFTNAASILMRPGAKLLLAFADSLTRPSADDDLAAVLLGAKQDGLHLLGRETGTCRYQMPPYERAAFTAAGFPGIPTDWRLGGLITLRRDERPAPPRRTVAEPEWVGCEIDGIPLRVRASAPAVGDTLLQPLLDGAILPSVSRRDLRRQQVALWTSRNRIYASSDPPALARVLSGSETADLPPELRAELAGILATERAEHGLVAPAAPSWVRFT